MSDALVALGVALFFGGLISGFVVQKLAIPRMGVTSHLEGTSNGMFLIITGLIWDRLELSDLWLNVVFWAVIYGTWANWAATLLAGIWGTGKATPISSGGRTGKPVHETVVTAMLLGVGITDTIAVVLIFIGLVA